MAKLLTQEKREEKFALMRERMRILQEIRDHPDTPPERPPSLEKCRRREQLQASIPAHLEMFRVSEVARMLGVSRTTVTFWFQDRAVVAGIPSQGPRLRRTLLISRQVLEDWVREHTYAGPEKQ